MNLSQIITTLAFASAACLARGDEYTVGGKAVNIPAPENYQNYLNVNKSIDEGIRKTAMISNNRVLAKFCTKNDFALVLGEKLVAPDSTFDIQVDIRYEKLDISAAEFEEIKKGFVEEYKDTADLRLVSSQIATGVQQSWDSLFGGKGSLEMIPSGVVGTTNRSVTFGAFTKQEEDGIVYVSYVLQTMFCIDGKLFSLFQTEFNPTDIDAFNKASIKWAKAIELEN